jgi:response regulator RpfG family c-di-GMP phosphodiesterase
MPLDESKEVAKIIRSHHECIDAQGFPDGPVGPDIPLGARLLSAVIDYGGLQIGTRAEKKLSADEDIERKRLEAQVHDLTKVLWGPDQSVILDQDPAGKMAERP